MRLWNATPLGPWTVLFSPRDGFAIPSARHAWCRPALQALLLLGTCLSSLSCTSIPAPAERTKLYAQYDREFTRLLTAASTELGKQVLRYETVRPELLLKRIHIAGTHYDYGHLVGLIARDYFGPPMKKEMTRRPEDAAINGRIVEMYRRVCPPYLDLVRGAAEAFDLTLEQVDLRYMEHTFFTLLWWRLFKYQRFEQLTDYYSPSRNIFDFSKCSVVSSYLPEQYRHLVGRNFDVSSDRPHFFVSTQMNGVNRTIGNACYMLYHWVEDGVNDKGLFVGVATNGSPSKYNRREEDYPDEPAIQVIHLVRIVLETCATVQEAIDLIGSVRVWFPVEVNHLLIADRAGNAAVVEFDTDRKMVVFRRDQPYLVLTNTAYQEGEDYLADNCRRYRRATAVLKGGVRDSKEMLAVMKAIQLRSGNSRTLWTSVADLEKLELDVRCRSENYGVPHVFQLSR